MAANNFGAGAAYRDFADFKNAFDAYCKLTRQVFVVKNCRTVAVHNQMSKGTLLNGGLKYAYVRYQCVHGNVRRHSREENTKFKRRTFKQGCPATIFVKSLLNDGQNKLSVVEFSEEHNHGLDGYEHYPSVRLSLDVNEKEDIKKLASLEISNRVLTDHIQARVSKKLTTKDVRNLKRRLIDPVPLNHDQETLFTLEKLLTDDPGSVVKYLLSSENVLTHVFFQTRSMRELFSKYPEVLLVDGTNRIADLRMRFYIMMIEDGFGGGQPIAFALLRDKTRISIDWFVKSFVTHNQSNGAIKTLIINKDFVEINVLREHIPDAKILLCTFHVLKTMRVAVKQLHRASSDDRDLLCKLCEKLVYAINEVTLFEEQMKQISDEFSNYYRKNWLPCKEMWMMKYRTTILHLQNNTTNRLESFNRHFKQLLSHQSSLSKFIQKLLVMVRLKREDTKQMTFKAMFSHLVVASSPEMLTIGKHVTPFALKKIEEQMEKSQMCKVNFSQSRLHEVQEADGTAHQVDEDKCNCSCSFFNNMHLPCMHVMALLKSRNSLPKAIDYINKRWSIEYATQNEDTITDVIKNIPTFEVHCQSKTIIDQDTSSKKEKYNEMFHLLQEIADLASENGMQSFQTVYDEFKKAKTLMLSSGTFDVIPSRSLEEQEMEVDAK